MGGLYVKGGGGEVGFLVLQPFMVACSSRQGTKRTEQEKNLHFMLYFSSIWTQAGYKQYWEPLEKNTLSNT